MKHIITLIFFFSLSFINHAKAQEQAFYVGDWNIIYKNTQEGMTEFMVKLVLTDGKLTGTVSSKKDGAMLIKKVEAQNGGIRISFKYGWFTSEMTLVKIDENNCSSVLVDKFSGKAKRVPGKGEMLQERIN